MPIYDRSCSNDHELLDRYEPITAPEVSCPVCGAATERVWLSKTANVIDDSIPGGILIRHGLVDANGDPVRYYSKSEIQAEAKRRGLVNIVEHKGDTLGSDKAKATQRWI